MGKSIIPIGKSLGSVFSEEGELLYFEWLRGDDNLELTPLEAMVLATAYDHFEEHSSLTFDRAAYFKLLQSRSETVSDAEINNLIDGLLKKGLLEEIDFASEPIKPFLKKYRIIPAARSYGNTKENPDHFGIGGTEPIIFLSGWAHTIWAVSHSDGSIWRGCELQAAGLPGVEPIDVAQDFVDSIPVMVATECAFLERI